MSKTFCSWCGGEIVGKPYYAADKGKHLFYFGSERCRDAWEKMKQEARAVCRD